MPDTDQLLVICHRPGLHRGGHANPRVASYPAGHFTLAQLQELDREPEITLLLGRTPSAEEIAAQSAEVIAAEGKKAVRAAKGGEKG